MYKFKISVSILAISLICSCFVLFWSSSVTQFNIHHYGNKIKLNAYYSFSYLFQSSFGYIPNMFNEPNAIAVDSLSGSLYVADTGNYRIQQFSHNGTFINTWGSEGDANSQFKSPGDISVNPSSGSVYVADTGNNRIQQFSHNGTFINAWGSYGTSSGQFIGPSGIAVNPSSGSVYVADTGNNRVQQFSHKGTFINTWS